MRPGRRCRRCGGLFTPRQGESWRGFFSRNVCDSCMRSGRRRRGKAVDVELKEERMRFIREMRRECVAGAKVEGGEEER